MRQGDNESRKVEKKKKERRKKKGRGSAAVMYLHGVFALFVGFVSRKKKAVFDRGLRVLWTQACLTSGFCHRQCGFIGLRFLEVIYEDAVEGLSL